MKKFILCFFFIFCSIIFSVSFADEGNNYKKIVSIVYDDSGSMLSLNNYCYSDYALQILTASLTQNDELNIVKVSSPYDSKEVDLSTPQRKQISINEIRQYSHNGGTYFDSVNTAKTWLASKKNIYGDGADYWFVVITDGEFVGMPADLEQYFTELNQNFNNLNYEFILLSIGSELTGNSLERAVYNSANSSVVSANDKESIYNSILSIANTINRGASDKIIKVTPINSKKIQIQVDLPLEKMMLLMQNTAGNVTNVKSLSNGRSLNVENYNASYNSSYTNYGEMVDLSASVVQVMDNSTGNIARGMYEIEFDNDVDVNNISFLCEAFVNAKISIVDENDKVLNDSQLKFLTSNKRIRVKCELLDGNGNSKIELSNTGVDFSNINVQLVNDKNKYNMTYDASKQAYYAELTLIGDNNNIYAIAEAKDVFRVKSNVLFIDTVANQMNVDKYDGEKIVFELPYSSKKEYEYAGTFKFNFIDSFNEINTAEDFELQLINLPNGVHVKYEDKEYGNNDKIPMIKETGKEYSLEILTNRDYKETAEFISTLKIITKAENTDIYWDSNGLSDLSITFKPKLYRLDIVKKSPDGPVDVNTGSLKYTLIKIDEQLNTVIGDVDVNDITKMETKSNFGSGYTYKANKNSDNTIEVTFKPNILAIFKSNIITMELDFELSNGKEGATYTEQVELVNLDVLGLLKPYIIAFILFIIAMGYVCKKKFNKKSQIAITENGDKVLYTLRPQIVTLLIPYMAHKAKIGMIGFKAGKNNTLVYSARGLEILKIDGEDLESYKETNSINLDKMIMKRDFSSIIINSFDVEQKYEYVTKEPESSTYSGDSGTDNYYSSDDSSYGSDYGDSYSDNYSDNNLF